jgi:hypothetical protein
MRNISLVAMAAAGFVMAMPLSITHAQSAPTDAHRPDAAQGTKPIMGGMMSKMMAEHSNMMMFHHTEGYLAFLKAELQITDAQSAPWTAYVDAVRSVAKKAHEAMPAMPGMAAAPGAPAMPAMPMMAAMSASWPDKLAANEKALTAQLDALKTMRPVVAALYAVLAPDQKKKADELGAGAKGMM